jgi:hypothetical protein
MGARKSQCEGIEAKMADLLLAPATVSAETRSHLETCAPCREELDSLRATLAALDAWEAPEPSPFFDGKLRARIRAEREAAPVGMLERLRARWHLGSLQIRPVMAGALAVVLAAGGGTAFWLEHDGSRRPVRQESATVRDLQSYDWNAQVFQQLNALDSDEDAGGANGAPSNAD